MSNSFSKLLLVSLRPVLAVGFRDLLHLWPHLYLKTRKATLTGAPTSTASPIGDQLKGV
jgi:hypothetical protein